LECDTTGYSINFFSMFGIFFDPENGENKFFLNAGKILADYT
jgi:hypothetical protein